MHADIRNTKADVQKRIKQREAELTAATPTYMPIALTKPRRHRVKKFPEQLVGSHGCTSCSSYSGHATRRRV